MTCDALQSRMSLHQRETGRIVVERAPRETRHRMTATAVLPELAAMRIGVTGGAGVGFWSHLCCWTCVTRHATHVGMTSEQRKCGPGVIDSRRSPRLRRVARLAARTKLLPVGVGMTACARCEGDALVAAVLVTRHTGDRRMRSREGERRPAVVELGSRGGESHRSRVTVGATRSQRTSMDVVVTGRTGGRGAQERTRLVTALAGDAGRGVQPINRKARLRRMVERTLIEGTQLRIDAGMLDVTRHAIGRHSAMDTALLRDSFCDRLVAGEALVGRDLSPRGVALEALADPLE